jgi:GR25 family glycosyltransferase involved in LPS biosynthesis
MSRWLGITEIKIYPYGSNTPITINEDDVYVSSTSSTVLKKWAFDNKMDTLWSTTFPGQHFFGVLLGSTNVSKVEIYTNGMAATMNISTTYYFKSVALNTTTAMITVNL